MLLKLENDLNYIKKNIEAHIRDLPFFSFKKITLKAILKTLSTINQNNIIFDEEKARFYHQQQIEIYLKNFDCFGFNVQYAWNVNKFTDYIKESNLKPRHCNPRLFLQHFETLELIPQLSFENKNQTTLNKLHPYKTKNPIIWLGNVDNENLDGFFVNGNHRVFNCIISNVPSVEIFCISNPFVLHDFLLNSDYKKLHKAMLKYMSLNRLFK